MKNKFSKLIERWKYNTSSLLPLKLSSQYMATFSCFVIRDPRNWKSLCLRILSFSLPALGLFLSFDYVSEMTELFVCELPSSRAELTGPEEISTTKEEFDELKKITTEAFRKNPERSFAKIAARLGCLYECGPYIGSLGPVGGTVLIIAIAAATYYWPY